MKSNVIPTPKKVKIILSTNVSEHLIANFKNNYYEAMQCAKLLQSKTTTSGYIYYVEFQEKNGTLIRRQP